jgi:hypothetical protein
VSAKFFNFLLERDQGIRVAAGDDEVSAGAGQRASEVLAETTARARYESNLAGESERFLAHAKDSF